MIVTTTLGDMDDSLLEKKVGEVDDENEYTTTVEYCLVGCTGNAHRSGVPDSICHFCNQHVHRSVHVTTKGVEAQAVAAALM